MLSAGGFGVKLSFKKMCAGGRIVLCKKIPDFWVPTIKVRQPDGSSLCKLTMHTVDIADLLEQYNEQSVYHLP